jgi:hypothetical protein
MITSAAPNLSFKTTVENMPKTYEPTKVILTTDMGLNLNINPAHFRQVIGLRHSLVSGLFLGGML